MNAGPLKTLVNSNQKYSHHAHVYYDVGVSICRQRAMALKLCETARDRFELKMGRMHDESIGPHPVGSCQLLLPTERSEEIINWLDENRQGLTVLIHTLSGDDYLDHTKGVHWLGTPCELDLSVFD